MDMNHTIRLMAEAFDNHGLKYQVTETGQYQEIHVPFGIQNGPFADVRFISMDRGNDTSVRIMNLVNQVPAEKRGRILEACNTLNGKYRFLKFEMDAENNVHVEYDLPICTGDESLGEMAAEIFMRTVQILNAGYILIAKALYASDESESEGKPEADESKNLMKLLERNHDKINITISKDPPSENPEK